MNIRSLTCLPVMVILTTHRFGRFAAFFVSLVSNCVCGLQLRFSVNLLVS